MPNQKKRKSSPRKNKKTSQSSSLRKISLILIIVGLISLSIPSLFYLNQTIQLSFFNPPMAPSAHASSHARPTAITVSKIHLTLPIKPTVISRNTWGIAKDAVSYLDTSSRPGDQGAIILYAHNTDDRFGPIQWLKEGEKIEVETADNKKHLYIITRTAEVAASDISVFNQSRETLVLYTCSGFADTKRFIVMASPLSNSQRTVVDILEPLEMQQF